MLILQQLFLSKFTAIEPGLLELLQKVARVRFFWDRVYIITSQICHCTTFQLVVFNMLAKGSSYACWRRMLKIHYQTMIFLSKKSKKKLTDHGADHDHRETVVECLLMNPTLHIQWLHYRIMFVTFKIKYTLLQLLHVYTATAQTCTCHAFII